MTNYIFSFEGTHNLEINVACPVTILSSEAQKICINIDSSNKNDEIADFFKVIQQRDTVFLNQASRITKAYRVTILAPPNGKFVAKMGGDSVLLSTIQNEEAILHLSGKSRVAVNAKTMQVDASDESNAIIRVAGGELIAKSSGYGKINATGMFKKVNAEVSGPGKIETTGTVSGDSPNATDDVIYIANANGFMGGRIIHRGEIRGKYKPIDASGMGIDLGLT